MSGSGIAKEYVWRALMIPVVVDPARRIPWGNSTLYEYENRGLLRRALNPMGVPLESHHDAHGHVINSTVSVRHL